MHIRTTLVHVRVGACGPSCKPLKSQEHANKRVVQFCFFILMDKKKGGNKENNEIKIY